MFFELSDVDHVDFFGSQFQLFIILLTSLFFSPSSINYTGPLTRTSTIDSAELELANRQNYLIVPSYSEAILLDPVHPNVG